MPAALARLSAAILSRLSRLRRAAPEAGTFAGLAQDVEALLASRPRDVVGPAATGAAPRLAVAA